MLGQSQSPVLGKLFFFRDVPASEENECRSFRDIRGPEHGS